MHPPSTLLSSRSRHKLFLELASLKHAFPSGVYVCPIPGSINCWSGVIFVRKGPFAPALLRFRITYPPDFPDHPPHIVFLSHLFHPLIVPFPTPVGSHNSSNPDSREPGRFSLRHGFPSWFDSSSPSSSHSHITLYEILSYIRSTLDSLPVLFSITPEYVVNKNAYYALCAYKSQFLLNSSPSSPSSSNKHIKGPADWNWDGVWQSRSSVCIRDSLTDSAVHGPVDDVIRFYDTDQDSAYRMIREIHSIFLTPSSIPALAPSP